MGAVCFLLFGWLLCSGVCGLITRPLGDESGIFAFILGIGLMAIIIRGMIGSEQEREEKRKEHEDQPIERIVTHLSEADQKRYRECMALPEPRYLNQPMAQQEWNVEYDKDSQDYKDFKAQMDARNYIQSKSAAENLNQDICRANTPQEKYELKIKQCQLYLEMMDKENVHARGFYTYRGKMAAFAVKRLEDQIKWIEGLCRGDLNTHSSRQTFLHRTMEVQKELDIIRGEELLWQRERDKYQAQLDELLANPV